MVSAYDERPWLGAYDSGQPPGIEPEHESALAMFEATVRRTPDAPAQHYFTSTQTFAEVDALSSALAAALEDLGVQRGDRVAAFLQNVPQFMVVMLAVWKASATLVSANAMLKHNELRGLLQDSGAVGLVTLDSLWHEVASETVVDTPVRFIITTSALDFLDGPAPGTLDGVERMPCPGTHNLVELTERFTGRSAQAPPPGRDDIAFLTYTSGTTGPPKGATNMHSNVVFNAQTYQCWAGLTPDDVVLGIAPLFHITGLVGHLAVSMLVGMPVVLQYRFSPAVALELIEHHRATFTIGSIAVFISLMNEPTADRYDMSSFRKLYTGGAPVAPMVVESFEQKFGGYIHNVYGLTETTSPSHMTPAGARAPVDPDTGALAVGLPVYDTMARIVDANRQELPFGGVGEIVISGPQVVPGYWEKPEETAHAMPGGALHTGDVGFMDEAGWFYVVDRMKDQINAAGFTIWPREVEDVLYAHPAVRDAAVVGAPDEYRGETVKAFVSLKHGSDATEDEIAAFCRERIAAYKYPRQVEILADLPKTETGKILRRELRDASGGERRASVTAPIEAGAPAPTTGPPGPAIGVLADDLSGALASASQLAACGLRTYVTWRDDTPLPYDAQAIVADLRTRDGGAPPFERARCQAAAAREAGCPRFELRIDSTLRGHPAQELAGLLEGAQLADPTVLAVPAWPAAGRVTVDGCTLVLDADGTEVDRLPFAERVFPGRETLHVGSRHLDRGSCGVVAAVERARRAGLRHVVVDAEDAEDLRVASQAAAVLEERGVELVTVSPGAWLTACEHLRPAAPDLPPAAAGGDFVIALVGSPTAVNGTCLDALARRAGAVLVDCDPASWPADALDAGTLVIHTHGERAGDAIDGGHSQRAAAAGAHALRAAAARGRRCGAAVVSGGRTAAALMDAVGAHRLRAAAEVAPLCGAGTVEGGDAAGMVLATKGGRVGDGQTLSLIIDSFERRQS